MINIEITKKRFVSLLVLILIATAIQTISTVNGVYEDPLMDYQAGLRHRQGQVLYRDFYLPHGPFGGLLFAFFLLVTPTGGFALILASVTLNVLAVILIWKILLITTNSLRYAFYGGLVTAFWYQVQMGGFYHHHLSYLFVLGAFLAAICNISQCARIIISAICFSLAFHSHQNIGLWGLAAFIIVSALFRGRLFFSVKELLSFSGIYITSHLIIIGSICLFSDINNYFYYTFHIPMKWASVNRHFFHPFISLLVPYSINPVTAFSTPYFGQLLFYPIVAVFYIAYLSILIKRKSLTKGNRFIIAFMALSTLWCSAVVSRSFTEVTFALGGILAMTLFSWRDKLSYKLEYTIISFYIILGVIFLGDNRHFFDNSEVKYFRSTDLFPVKIKQSDFPHINLNAVSDVIEYLKGRSGNIAVIDDNGMLISLAIRKAPLNPTLYYDQGLTVPSDTSEREKWQYDFIEKLEQHEVHFFVNTLPATNMQFRWWFEDRDGQSKTLPLLVDYIETHYSLVCEKEGIMVYKRIHLSGQEALTPK